MPSLTSSTPEKNATEINSQIISRNFRASYYEKVGFRGVLDNAKSLEIILNERPLNLSKLECFAQKYSIASIYREKVWMLLSGLLMPDSEYEAFILNEQKILCQDLCRPLFVLGFLDENTPIARKMTLMYLLNQGSLSIHTSEQINDNEKRNLLAIANIFANLSPNFENTFWLFKEFIQKIKNMKINFTEIKNELKSELQSKHPELHSHLNKVVKGSYEEIPLKYWSDRCFASIVDADCLIKIWDKVMAGSYPKLFLPICKYLIVNLKSEILQCKTTSAIRNLLLQPIDQMNPVEFDSIINICCCSSSENNSINGLITKL